MIFLNFFLIKLLFFYFLKFIFNFFKSNLYLIVIYLIYKRRRSERQKKLRTKRFTPPKGLNFYSSRRRKNTIIKIKILNDFLQPIYLLFPLCNYSILKIYS